MPKLPTTPELERLGTLDPQLTTLPAGTPAYRIYRRGGAHPMRWNEMRYYGPTDARFDHHFRDEDDRAHVQSRGITYFATDIPTTLAEVYQSNRTVDRHRHRPWLVAFVTERDLTLLDLTDTFPVQAGASMKLVSGPRSVAHNWSRGFYDVYASIHGLYYFSSMTNRPVVALYERAETLNPFPAKPRFHRALADPLLLDPIQEACVDIGYEYT